MYKNRFNQTRRAFNKVNRNAQGRENENQGAKRGLPKNIAPIVHVLKTNKDVRTYCSKVLINLHRHNGDIEDNQKNSWGGTEKLDMTPLYDWGSGHFGAKAKAYDLSCITEDHVLHIGFMNIGSESASKYFKFTF